jgi:alkanesulfonate monooxygenase SsuD/methylene tetrahydromethanopterin reductase-like flavin-dependent oxidoreductase (luciferase family)
VERLRGRRSAVDFAHRHCAGTPDEHVARYRRLAARGVDTVFAAFPDLSGPDEVERFAAVIAQFS